MKDIIYINGALVPRGEARISPFDRGFLYGYGLFETMRSYRGRVFRLDRHLARLMNSAERLGLAALLDPAALEQAIQKTLEANRLRDARIRLSVSAGEGERGLEPPESGTLTIIVVAQKLVPPTPQAYGEGVSAAIVSARRNSQSPLSGIKSMAYLESLLAHSEAVAAGADEAILLSERGTVAECSTSNIFLVVGERLLTPSAESGILPGITREVVLEMAQGLGITTVVGEIQLADLLGADEAFLTNSIVEVMPITQVDGKPVGSGRPGEMTKRLLKAYKELVLQQGHDY
ncbi:MAG TPA: aminotransferase class IV [Dehalococcoidia bacterium]|nr:aminotransferase class IV [Dehalococcoidia bacterium]